MPVLCGARWRPRRCSRRARRAGTATRPSWCCSAVERRASTSTSSPTSRYSTCSHVTVTAIYKSGSHIHGCLSHPYQSSFPVRHLCEHESTPLSLPSPLVDGQALEVLGGTGHMDAALTELQALTTYLLSNGPLGPGPFFRPYFRLVRQAVLAGTMPMISKIGGAKRGGCLLVVGGLLSTGCGLSSSRC